MRRHMTPAVLRSRLAGKGNVVTLLDVPSTDELTDEALAGPQRPLRDRLSRRDHPLGRRLFHPHLCLTASMTDAVLIDLATSVEPAIEVVFIDTGYHFPETLETVEVVRRRYGLNLRVMTAPPTRSSCGRSTRRTAARRSKPASSIGPCSASRPG